MGLLRNRHYDRNRIMAEAQRAVKAKRLKRAAALYREVLAAEPNNCELHRRLAPLLAQTHEPAAAWQSYKCTVEGLVRNKLLEEAAGVLREAGETMPKQIGVWLTLARIELKRGRALDARKVLLRGRAFLRNRRDLPLAIELLQRALQLWPEDFETRLDLADSLARSGQRVKARLELERLALQAEDGGTLRRIRARQFRLSPTPTAGWRWLRASRPPGPLMRQARAV